MIAIVCRQIEGICSRNEESLLMIGDIDLDDERVDVLGKGKYNRVGVKLFAPTRELLKVYLASLGTLSGKAPLFPCLTTRQVRYRVDAALEAAGLNRMVSRPTRCATRPLSSYWRSVWRPSTSNNICDMPVSIPLSSIPPAKVGSYMSVSYLMRSE